MRLVSPTDGETLKQGMAKPKSARLDLRVEQSTLTAVQESAEGILGLMAGKASEALKSRKVESTDRPSRKPRD